MPALPDCFCVGTSQDFDDVVQTEAEAALSAHAMHAGEKFLSGDGAIECLLRGQAIVAAVARLVRPLFAEIAQQRRAPAFTRLRVMHHLAQLLACDPRFAFGFLLDETRL